MDKNLFLWGPAVHTEKGFSPVPHLFFKNFHRLGISPLAAILLLNLMRRKSETNLCPRPSLKTLGEELGFSPRRLRELLKMLEEKGFLRRQYRRGEGLTNQTTLYDLSPVHETLLRILKQGHNNPARRRKGDVEKPSLEESSEAKPGAD
ncbi:helix-turn-helix domain-containing protein [bacterium CPR1]|nr:helix-turn-helix domain-containing protein [bacterium CPR1]